MKTLVLIPSAPGGNNVVRDLLYGCWCQGGRIGGAQFPPVSQLLLVTMLRAAGHEALLYDARTSDPGHFTLKGVIHGYGLVFLLTASSTFGEDSRLLGELKKLAPSVKTVCYGAHPTFCTADTLGAGTVDIAVRGEPELIICELAAALDKKGDGWKGVKGISYSENGGIVSNPAHELISDLDSLPVPARGLLPEGEHYFNPIVNRYPYTTMMTSRGCSGRCSYCTSPAFYGRKYRAQSCGRVLMEIKAVKAGGFRELIFRDENFACSRERTLEICRGIRKEFPGLPWTCSSRADSLDPELLGEMKKAGCKMVRIGVESGDDVILSNIRKGVTSAQVASTVRAAHAAGLRVHAHMMIGSPGETELSFSRSLRFIKSLSPLMVTFGICTPLPGTELFNGLRVPAGKCPGEGLLSLEEGSVYSESISGFSGAALRTFLRRAYLSYYMRPGYMLSALMQMRGLKELLYTAKAGFFVFLFIISGVKRRASDV